MEETVYVNKQKEGRPGLLILEELQYMFSLLMMIKYLYVFLMFKSCVDWGPIFYLQKFV